MPDIRSLFELRECPPGEISTLDTATLATLADQLENAKKAIAEAEARLTAGIDLKFGERVQQKRSAEGKDTGRVRIEDGPFTILADRSKKVEWDQEALAAIAARIREAGDDPADYVRTKLEVSETAFKSWPSTIRRQFEPARTVKTGKPTYFIERRESV